MPSPLHGNPSHCDLPRSFVPSYLIHFYFGRTTQRNEGFLFLISDAFFFSNQQPHYNNTSQLIKQGNHKFSSSLFFPSNGWSPCICSLSFSSSFFHCTPQHSRPFLSLISLELHTWRKFKLNFWF